MHTFGLVVDAGRVLFSAAVDVVVDGDENSSITFKSFSRSSLGIFSANRDNMLRIVCTLLPSLVDMVYM